MKKFDPFRDILFLQERMSRIFDETLLRYGAGAGLPGGGILFPPVDIYESEEHIVLKAEIPGINAEHVSVEVNDNTLILKGERKLDKDFDKENYHRMERFCGTFQRVFSLPYSVDRGNIKARYTDGVLKITVPKSGTVKAKGIKINVL